MKSFKFFKPALATTLAIGSWRLVLLLATAVSLIGYPNPASAATFDVLIGRWGGLIEFLPSSVRIHPGDKVKWHWLTGGHSTTSGRPGMPNHIWNSGVRSQGATFTHTFNTAGTFRYYCTRHPNWVGRVIVTSATTPLTGPPIETAKPVGRPSPSPTPPTTYSGHIVYTAHGTLHIFNPATSSDTSLGVSGVNPKFSRDGSRIVYQNGGIWIVNSAPAYSPRQLSPTGGTPSFSPDGTQIVYNDSGIWKMNADGTNKTHLTLSGQQPSYSADGTQIVYNAAVGGVQQLFVMNPDGTNARQVLTSGAVIDTVWCPGLKIVMGVLSGRNYQLSTYDPNTPGSLTTLTSSSGDNFEPSWSSDASHISWTSMVHTNGIWIMNADGSNPQLVISGGRQGSWGP